MRHSRKTPVLLLLGCSLSLSVIAQQDNDLPNLSTITAGDELGKSTSTSDASSSTGTGSSKSSSDGTSSTDSASTTSSTPSDSSSDTLPSLTSSTTSSSGSPLPTLQGVGVPPLIVPDTSAAPFMQKSNLPEGTVFIAVGAALGFLGMCVLAWRGLVAWSLKRSVKKAAHTTYASETKSMFGLGSGGGYSSVYDAKNISLEQLTNTNTSYGGPGHAHRRSSHMMEGKSQKPKGERRERQSKTPTSSSLFFSPTAGAGAGAGAGTGMQPSTDRHASYMPAGYYASGVRDSNGNYGRVGSIGGGISPPDSPALGTSRPASQLRPTSSYDLLSGPSPGREQAQRRSRLAPDAAAPAPGRAPSAYLEDLFNSPSHSRHVSPERR
ncbi:MAG: hypothetical protein M1828_000141 [Chrysothrix sp. TS-e1954]|nr:MAG: hypothetical protein M1828_000141 [Chrysothrix sp. TS-e1954]